MAENYQELSRLLANRGVQRNDGAASSIANLFNSGGQQQRQFLTGMKGGAQLADIMAQARQRQLAGVGREGLAKIAEDAGNFKLANMFRMGADASDVAHADQMSQESTQRGQMYNDATDPNNLELNNRRVAALAKEPVALSAVEGNSIVDRFKTADHQTFSPTQVGQADIAEKGAQAKSALAAAFEHTQQGERARAGIGADKAANYEIKEGADGTMYRVPKLSGGEATPITAGGQPLKGNVTPKVGERLQEGMLNHALSSDGGSAPDPQMVDRYLARKQQLGPQASDFDVIASLKKDDQDAATDPTVDPSPPGTPNKLQQLFGAPVGNTTGQPYPDPNAVGSSPNFNGPNATMPASSTNIFQNGAPHPEGTKLRGPDGKLYIVQNGQPVPAPAQ